MYYTFMVIPVLLPTLMLHEKQSENSRKILVIVGIQSDFSKLCTLVLESKAQPMKASHQLSHPVSDN